MNNKGFSLIETVILCTAIISLLLLCYYPYKTIVNDYYLKKDYDTVENIYKLNNIRNYIYKYGNINKLIEQKADRSVVSIKKLEFSDTEITNNYNDLLSMLDIKSIYFSNYTKINYEGNNYNIAAYIDHINFESTTTYKNIFRIIAEFKDGTYGNIKIWRET